MAKLRKAVCTLLYKLGVRRLAYKVSPSVCGYLYGKEVQARLAEGLQYAASFAAALKEGGADNDKNPCTDRETGTANAFPLG